VSFGRPKVAGVTESGPGQTVMIGSGPSIGTAVIVSVGTAGSTRAGAATQVGDTVIPVAATAGFVVGQSITIDSGANQETATIAAVQGGRGDARITTRAPLKIAHAARHFGGRQRYHADDAGRQRASARRGGGGGTAEPGATNKYSNLRVAR
jgi:hypothetical protein